MDEINLNKRNTDNNFLLMTGLIEKPQVAKLLHCGKRTVDNYMAQGMPHQKPSPRKVTFDAAEVLKWYKQKYGQQLRRQNN